MSVLLPARHAASQHTPPPACSKHSGAQTAKGWKLVPSHSLSPSLSFSNRCILQLLVPLPATFSSCKLKHLACAYISSCSRDCNAFGVGCGCACEDGINLAVLCSRSGLPGSHSGGKLRIITGALIVVGRLGGRNSSVATSCTRGRTCAQAVHRPANQSVLRTNASATGLATTPPGRAGCTCH